MAKVDKVKSFDLESSSNQETVLESVENVNLIDKEKKLEKKETKLIKIYNKSDFIIELDLGYNEEIRIEPKTEVEVSEDVLKTKAFERDKKNLIVR